MASKRDRAILAAEQLLQASFDAILDGISVLGTDLTILRVNKMMEQWYSHAMPLVGKKCYEVYRSCKQPCAVCPTLSALGKGEFEVEEVPLIQEGIQTGWLELYVNPIKDNQGRITGVVEIVRDITARRKAEEEIKQRQEWCRTLTEDIPALVSCASPQGQLTFVSNDYCHFLGKTQEEIVGQNFYEFIPMQHHLLVKNALLLLTPDNPIAQYVHTNRYYNGTLRWIRWTNRAIFNPDGSLKEYISVGEDITDRTQAKDALQYQFHFEKIVADISATFVSVPGEKIDHAIGHALKLSGSFFNTDRSYLFRFSEDGLFINNTHEWCAEGISSQMTRNQNYPLDFSSWWAAQILELGHVHVPDIELLPPEAETDRYEFISEEKKSLFNIPMFKEGKMFGFFGFDAVKEKKHWTDQEIALIKVVAEIIAGAVVKYEAEESLKDSEERYREILATIEEICYETDLEGNLIFWNDAAFRMTGYCRDEVLGKSSKHLYKDPDTVFSTFNRVYLTSKPEKGVALEMIRKDGTVIFGEISIVLIRDKARMVNGFKCIGRDITERIQFEAKLNYLSLHDHLTGIYNRAFFEEELDRLNGGREYPVTIISAVLSDLRLINDTLSYEAGNRMLLDCAVILKESLRQSDILARVGGDEFAVILPRTDKVTGENIVCRIRENLKQYNHEHEELPLGISVGVATTDNSAIALKDLFKRADDLMYRDKLYRSGSSRTNIVKSLLATLAERDYITEGHARRLEELCRAVGAKSYLSAHQLSDLVLLAQVHDLGKIGIPDNILFKPGPLSAEEWEVMREHTGKGYRIASSSPDLSGVADLILKHHERWDGSGYPLGLKETEIPVECRILAVVDAFDAMTSKRPYNKRKSVAKAKAE
ncbi:MAG TPA: PAS domain S-box protein, partial [Candidatus Limnocylindrales bacterium]|nr:PAS domain S-box protein [Candidatus Limnocylindrales bacterium]